MSRSLIGALVATLLACGLANSSRASDCDEVIGRHMTGQSMLAAYFIASAEKGGMTAHQINAVLKAIAENSAIEEFWIYHQSVLRSSAFAPARRPSPIEAARFKPQPRSKSVSTRYAVGVPPPPAGEEQP